MGISDSSDVPARAFEQAGDAAVVVLNHNRAAGYIVSGRGDVDDLLTAQGS